MQNQENLRVLLADQIFFHELSRDMRIWVHHWDHSIKQESMKAQHEFFDTKNSQNTYLSIGKLMATITISAENSVKTI
jgi:hypothetical protein